LDLYDKGKGENQKEKVSILADVDFELELIHRDEINVSYILKLLTKLKDAPEEEKEKQQKAIVDPMVGESQLRSKRELVEKFIRENLPHIEDSEQIQDEFAEFWTKERIEAIRKLSEEEGLESERLEDVISRYIYTEKEPLRDEVVSIMKNKPGLSKRRTTAERVIGKIVDFVETFISGIAAA
ncbi:MAG: deoxyribonuclease HsdR, partial [Cyclobacterium sp.]|nr:deoxyribonuclease HsdR [Cyclobacterium sp.]